MKRFSFMFVVLVAFLAPAMVAAAPVYFTIEGTVSSIWDGAGHAESAGVNMGDTVQYVVAVDSDVQGSYTLGGRTIQVFDSVFSSLEKGILGGFSYNPENDAMNNYVHDYGNRTDVFAGNANANLYVSDFYNGLSQLAEGGALGTVYEMSYAARDKVFSRIDLNDITITNVSTHATPLPAGILLLGSGAGALVLVRRRIKISD